ncbi:hypothetical protein D9M71_746610 [compost metagenome]
MEIFRWEVFCGMTRECIPEQRNVTQLDQLVFTFDTRPLRSLAFHKPVRTAVLYLELDTLIEDMAQHFMPLCNVLIESTISFDWFTGIQPVRNFFTHESIERMNPLRPSAIMWITWNRVEYF